MLAVFSPIFEVDTKIILDYNFGATSNSPNAIAVYTSIYLLIYYLFLSFISKLTFELFSSSFLLIEYLYLPKLFLLSGYYSV